MSRWYAGRWRSEKGIEAHRAARRERMNRPINRIRADLSSAAIKRERATHASRTAREV